MEGDAAFLTLPQRFLNPLAQCRARIGGMPVDVELLCPGGRTPFFHMHLAMQLLANGVLEEMVGNFKIAQKEPDSKSARAFGIKKVLENCVKLKCDKIRKIEFEKVFWL